MSRGLVLLLVVVVTASTYATTISAEWSTEQNVAGVQLYIKIIYKADAALDAAPSSIKKIGENVTVSYRLSNTTLTVLYRLKIESFNVDHEGALVKDYPIEPGKESVVKLVMPYVNWEIGEMTFKVDTCAVIRGNATYPTSVKTCEAKPVILRVLGPAEISSQFVTNLTARLTIKSNLFVDAVSAILKDFFGLVGRAVSEILDRFVGGSTVLSFTVNSTSPMQPEVKTTVMYTPPKFTVTPTIVGAGRRSTSVVSIIYQQQDSSLYIWIAAVAIMVAGAVAAFIILRRS